MSAVFANMMILCPAMDILQTANWTQRNRLGEICRNTDRMRGRRSPNFITKLASKLVALGPCTIRQAYSGLQKDISPIMRSEYLLSQKEIPA